MKTILTPLDVLVAARKLIDDPKHWTKGTYARNAEGDHSVPDSDKATCWCSIGAIMRAAHGQPFVDTKAIAALHRTGVTNVAGFNDAVGRKHFEVLKLFDNAIAQEREAEGTV